MPHRVDRKLKNTNRKFYFPNTLSFENGGEAATLKTLVSHPSLYNILLVLLRIERKKQKAIPRQRYIKYSR